MSAHEVASLCTYRFPARLRLNQWALAGDWTLGAQAAVASSGSGRIAFRFQARDLHLVMGTAAPPPGIRFRVLLDGKPPGAAHGVDVDGDGYGYGTVSERRLYLLVRQSGAISDRVFEIEFLDAGAEAYAFTFG